MQTQRDSQVRAKAHGPNILEHRISCSMLQRVATLRARMYACARLHEVCTPCRTYVICSMCSICRCTCLSIYMYIHVREGPYRIAVRLFWVNTLMHDGCTSNCVLLYCLPPLVEWNQRVVCSFETHNVSVLSLIKLQTVYHHAYQAFHMYIKTTSSGSCIPYVGLCDDRFMLWWMVPETLGHIWRGETLKL